MIARMAKVEIVGPKGRLQDVLALLRELGIFQVEPATVGFIEEGHEEDVRSFALDEKAMFERLFLTDLRQKIEELISYLPALSVRTCYLEPRSIIDAVAKTVEGHVAAARELFEQRDARQKERTELGRYTVFFSALSSLVGSAAETPDLDFIGLTIREPEMVDRLREAISRITDWKFELTTAAAEDGGLIGLITVEKGLSDKVKKSLSDEQVPELVFPPSFEGLNFPEKIAYVRRRLAESSAEIQRIDAERSLFAQRWAPIYRCVREWIDDRLSLLKATAVAFETRMCFFINGWMPADDVETIGQKLARSFGESVVVVEKEIHEEELERVPIMLKNPPYFKPFEILTSILPLPAYTSYDPTPFIGIFFPLFFGMILGDAGYGLFLVVISSVLMRKFRRRKAVRDGATVLMIASLYSIFFGVLFGEFFGDLPERIFHVRPFVVERREAVLPMLTFALTVGAAHVLLGLFLGVLSGFRKKEKKEAVYKLLSIIVILGLIIVLATFFGLFPSLLARPVVIAVLFLTPLLFFTGGLLAPLELLKSIGHIISYARIMAVGLASVLLAFVANRLGGLTGDLVTGTVVAGLLHLFNLVLGVFSPTIQTLRLHYVEFFSKFIEHGGRKFEPFKK